MKKMKTVPVMPFLPVSSMMAYAPIREGEKGSAGDVPERFGESGAWEAGSRADDRNQQDNRTDARGPKRSAASFRSSTFQDQDEFGGSWFDGFEDLDASCDASGLPRRYSANEAG